MCENKAGIVEKAVVQCSAGSRWWKKAGRCESNNHWELHCSMVCEKKTGVDLYSRCREQAEWSVGESRTGTVQQEYKKELSACGSAAAGA